MPSVSIRFLLTVTSLAPVLLVLAAVFASNDESFWSLTWSGQKTAVTICVLLMLGLAIICHNIITFFRAEVGDDYKKFTSLKVADKSAVTFIFAYLLPLVTAQEGDMRWSVLATGLLLVAVLVFHSDAYLVNPLLAMPPFRYHFYEVTTQEEVSFILVSRREIVNTRESVEVQQVSRFMFLEVEGQKD